MKNRSTRSASLHPPGGQSIGDYTWHLFLQGDGPPGPEFDDWLEATARLQAENSRAPLTPSPPPPWECN